MTLVLAGLLLVAGLTVLWIVLLAPTGEVSPATGPGGGISGSMQIR